jgi:hypothetical protein
VAPLWNDVTGPPLHLFFIQPGRPDRATIGYEGRSAHSPLAQRSGFAATLSLRVARPRPRVKVRWRAQRPRVGSGWKRDWWSRSEVTFLANSFVAL